MNIEEIQKYIKDNNITSDFENDYRPIDYVNTMSSVSPISKDRMKELINEFSKAVKESGIKFVVIDSLSSMSP